MSREPHDANEDLDVDRPPLAPPANVDGHDRTGLGRRHRANGQQASSRAPVLDAACTSAPAGASVWAAGRGHAVLLEASDADAPAMDATLRADKHREPRSKK
jgi:hypothetical protein